MTSDRLQALARRIVSSPRAETHQARVAFTGELLTAEGKVEKGDESTVDGTPVIELIDSKDQGVLSISLEGEPLPLQVSSGTEGEVQFSDWNASVEVEAPAADEIVDLQSLLGS